MVFRLSSRSRRLALAASCIAIVLGTATASAAAQSESLVPYIIGGQEASITQFPWQVYVLLDVEEEGEHLEASCGGSILDATHILTAAHCVDHEGTTTSYPASDLVIAAGAEVVEDFGAHVEPAPGDHWQQDFVKSFRADPLYTTKPEIKDDVAVLELKQPLKLTPEFNSQPISLVPAGATPAPGTPLSVSGYGKEAGAESELSNGKFYSASLTAISGDACRSFVGLNSAVLMCAESATSSTCQGDSGGPLTEGSPAVQVAIVDFGAKECPLGKPDVFTNLAAPEVRAFIEGSESPPLAPRATAAPSIKSVGATPVDFSPLTCEPGEWSGSPSFLYTFEAETAAKTVLQSGPGNVFLPPSGAVGAPLVCIVQASNPGGVSTFRSPSTAPVALDAAAPSAAITGLPKCHLQSCTLAIAATDPNAEAITLVATADYTAVVKCPAKKRKRRTRPARAPICRGTKTVAMAVANPSAGVYQASGSGLPYGEQVKFSVLATNAAGVRQAAAAVASVTLHKPKAKRKRRKH